MNNWISVSERLPDLDSGGVSDVVLAATSDGIVLAAEYAVDEGIVTWYVAFNSDEMELGNVTHWMPMPKPPTQ